MSRTVAGPNLDVGLAGFELRRLIKVARRLPISFWALTAYFFFEYVRPQSAYPGLDFLPWAWLSLLSAALSSIAEASGIRRSCIGDLALVVFSLVLFTSLIGAYDASWGVAHLDVWYNWLLVYILVTATINTQDRIFVFLCTWMLWNLKMSLFSVRSWASIGFGFRDWGVGGAPGWFQNSGEFGIEMCVVMPISLYFALGLRPYVTKTKFLLLLVLPVTALMGSVASSSRGAMLGMAAIGLWMLLRSRYKVRALIGLVLVGLLFFTLIPPESKARFSSAGSDNTSTTRLTYWSHGIQIANDHPVLGVGYAGWLSYYADHYPPPVQLSHNIFIECVSELGYTGLAALMFVIAGLFMMNARTRRLAKRLGPDGRFASHLAHGFDGALIGYLVSGSFVTVLYYPYLWVNLALTSALYLTARRSVRLSSTPDRAIRKAESGSPLVLRRVSRTSPGRRWTP